MEDTSPANYITLDVDLVSSEDLSPLASYLEKETFVLGNQQMEGLSYLSFEPIFISRELNTPENSANLIFGVLKNLPTELGNLWERASSKTFNFGFESGVTPLPYMAELKPGTLRKIADLGASIAVTIYQHDSLPSERVE
jgi:hypothetical protein